MATTMAPPPVAMGGSGRAPHSGRRHGKGKSARRPQANAGAVLGVLLQGADKAWLQEMAQLPLEDLEARRDKCLEEVGSLVLRFPMPCPASQRVDLGENV